MTRAIPPFGLRLPGEIKAWIKREAGRNGASQNSEIVRRLRADMDRETEAQASRKATTGHAA